MPRPQPLPRFSSALPEADEYINLTPRTPHSRTARLEGGFAKLQVSDATDFANQDFMMQQQSAPLLHSSTSATFADGRLPESANSTKRASESKPPSRVLLALSVFTGVILVLMIALSWMNPRLLYQYIGLDYDALASVARDPASKSAQGVPLEPLRYFDTCNKLMGGFHSHGGYWDESPFDEGNVSTHIQAKDPVKGTCSSTITYMLDGRVGLAADLALMAQVAALARERNRTFFVDDTYWNRGKWLDHFEDVRIGQPGPEPGCKPPPASDLVSCPRTTKHWVLSSVTSKFHLGHAYRDHYENPFKHEINRQRPLFDRAVESFMTVIQPNLQSQNLINLAKQDLAEKFRARPHDAPWRDTHGGSQLNQYIAVHVRRGDRRPRGYKHKGEPIPLQVYLDFINQTGSRLGEGVKEASAHSFIYIASDDPLAAQELQTLYEGPSYTFAQSKLAELKKLVSEKPYVQKDFDALTAAKRRDLTKGAIVDLAMVSGLWQKRSNPVHLEATICSVSSNFCRLAAIGLGWDAAFGEVSDLGEIDEAHKKWVDVDVQGLEIPAWESFELF